MSTDVPFQSVDLVHTQLFMALQKGDNQNNPTTQLNLGICCHHAKRVPCFLAPNPLQLALRGGGIEPFGCLINAGAQLPDTMYAMGCCTCMSHISVHNSSMGIPFSLHGNVGRNSLQNTASDEFWNGEPECSWLDQDTTRDYFYEIDSRGTEKVDCIGGNHDTDYDHCRYSDECWWNPLFQVKEKQHFCEVFKIMPSTHQELWVTCIISSRVARACEWNFVSRLIDTGMIPEKHAYQQNFLTKSICAEDERWAEGVLEKGNPPQNTAQLGFILAVQNGNSSLVKTFLNFGYWPDERFKADDFRYRFRVASNNGLRGSPLSFALQLKDNMFVTIFTDYYKARSHERPSTSASIHLPKLMEKPLCGGI